MLNLANDIKKKPNFNEIQNTVVYFEFKVIVSNKLLKMQNILRAHYFE